MLSNKSYQVFCGQQAICLNIYCRCVHNNAFVDIMRLFYYVFNIVLVAVLTVSKSCIQRRAQNYVTSSSKITPASSYQHGFIDYRAEQNLTALVSSPSINYSKNSLNKIKNGKQQGDLENC